MVGGKHGLTLLDILVSTLIGGIFMAMAVPGYLRAMEEQRKNEGKYVLARICTAELRYQSETGTFTTDWSDLGIDDPTNLRFTYRLDPDPKGVPLTNNFLARATRSNVPLPYELKIDRRGNVEETAVGVVSSAMSLEK